MRTRAFRHLREIYGAKTDREVLVIQALERLREARDTLAAAGCRRTLARVRWAITSCEGARRHARHDTFRKERAR